MKFRYKLVISTVLLLCLSFGIGGTILIDKSFKSSLSYATENHLQNYQNVQNTLLIVTDMGSAISYEELSTVLSQLAVNNSSTWSYIRFMNTDTSEVIYAMNTPLVPIDLAIDEETNTCVSKVWSQGDSYYYQITGTMNIRQGTINASTYTGQLDIVYDISSIYNSRHNEQNIFRWLLIIIIIIGSLLSFAVAYIMTKPLETLSHVVKNISDGNMEARADIHSGDEIERLAADFNEMADTIKGNILELQSSIDRQEQFMGSFAHELKTPMTSIIGYADLLRSHNMDAEEVNEASNYIFSEGRRLESLSLKLLELLVVKNQQTELHPANPANVIKNVINIMKPELSKEGITLKSTCENGNCMLDSDLFQSLIFNITDNSRKAMDNGGTIHISGRVKNGQYIIIIKDNGRGMPPEELDRITDAFYRIDKSRSRAQGGAGLGLSICVKIAEIHDANIKFKSAPGRGTVVTITLKEVDAIHEDTADNEEISEYTDENKL